MRRISVEGSKKKTNRKTSPPPIVTEIVETGSYDVDDLNKGIVFCLRHLGGRPWPAWERKLLDDARDGGSLGACLDYAREILSGSWPELEPLLLLELETLEEYLGMTAGPRCCPAIEKAILTGIDSEPHDCARAAYLYARLAIQGRWEAGERVILEATRLGGEDADYEASEAVAETAEAYRKLAFPRAAWPELIRMIRAGECDPCFSVDYCCKSRMDWMAEVAEGLLNTPVTDGDEMAERAKRERLAEAAFDFACRVIDGRWEAGEKLLGTDPDWLHLYATEVVKDVLPDSLHRIMMMHSFGAPDDDVKAYFKWVAKKATQKQSLQPAEADPV